MTILRRLIGLIVLPVGVQILWMVVQAQNTDRREMFFMSPNVGIPTLPTMTVVVVSFVAMVVEWLGAFSSLLLVLHSALAAFLAYSCPREVVRFYVMGSVLIGVLCSLLSEKSNWETLNFSKKEQDREARRSEKRSLELADGTDSANPKVLLRAYTYKKDLTEDHKAAVRKVSLYWHMFTTLKPKSAQNFFLMLLAIFLLAVLTYFPAVSYFFQITVEFDVCRSHCLDAICEPDRDISRAEDVDLLPGNHTICLMHRPVIQFNRSDSSNVSVYDINDLTVLGGKNKDESRLDAAWEISLQDFQSFQDICVRRNEMNPRAFKHNPELDEKALLDSWGAFPAHPIITTRGKRDWGSSVLRCNKIMLTGLTSVVDQAWNQSAILGFQAQMEGAANLNPGVWIDPFLCLVIAIALSAIHSESIAKRVEVEIAKKVHDTLYLQPGRQDLKSIEESTREDQQEPPSGSWKCDLTDWPYMAQAANALLVGNGSGGLTISVMCFAFTHSFGGALIRLGKGEQFSPMVIDAQSWIISRLYTFLALIVFLCWFLFGWTKYRAWISKVAVFDSLWKFPKTFLKPIKGTKKMGLKEKERYLDLREGTLWKHRKLPRQGRVEFLPLSSDPDKKPNPMQMIEDLNRWYYLREHLQLDMTDERIELELLLVLVLFWLFLTVLRAAATFVSQGDLPLNGGSLTCVLDSTTYTFCVVKALGTCRLLNEHFDDHVDDLKSLMGQVLLKGKQEICENCATNTNIDMGVAVQRTTSQGLERGVSVGQDDNGGVEFQQQNDWLRVHQVIRAMLNIMDENDEAQSLLGVKVNRQLQTRVAAVIFTALVTQGILISKECMTVFLRKH